MARRQDDLQRLWRSSSPKSQGSGRRPRRIWREQGRGQEDVENWRQQKAAECASLWIGGEFLNTYTS